MKKIAKLPKTPGVYLFKNRQKNILYVGKAKNLRSRVESYWRKSSNLTVDKKVMVQQITDLDIIKTKTEADAIALESDLIKKYKPRFNIKSTDDKSFIFIEITKEKFPRVLAVRQPNLRKSSYFYGPYASAKSARMVLRLLHRIFPFRTCRNLPKKLCLEYFMNRCQGPCIKEISEDKYNKIIEQVIDFFEGKDEKIYKSIEKKMQTAAKNQEFEKATVYRNQLWAINKLKAIKKTPHEYLSDYYKNKAISPNKGLRELAGKLKIKNKLNRIEIFDISNIQGKFAVGSMVVFTKGLPDKSEYRRFRIKTVNYSNDVAMLKEVVTRRLKHKDWPQADLMILDGGKAQLKAARNILTPVIALAKREEQIFQPHKKNPILLKPDSQGYFFIQRMRDEAHRFAIAYYRKLHQKSIRPE